MRSNITFKELADEIVKKLKFKNAQNFRLFDSSGIEMLNTDIELIKSAPQLYASEGTGYYPVLYSLNFELKAMILIKVPNFLNTRSFGNSVEEVMARSCSRLISKRARTWR